MKISPKKANEKQTKALKSAKKQKGNFWISSNGKEITIAKDNEKGVLQQYVTIDKETFNKFITWYNRDQVTDS